MLLEAGEFKEAGGAFIEYEKIIITLADSRYKCNSD